METDITKYIGNTFQDKNTGKLVYIFHVRQDSKQKTGPYKYHMYFYDGILRGKYISDTRFRDLKKVQYDSKNEATRYIISSIFEPHSDKNVAITERIDLKNMIKDMKR